MKSKWTSIKKAKLYDPKASKKSATVTIDSKKLNQMRSALVCISEMGAGLKPEIIDWTNIGKNAVYVARQALMEKCTECGQSKPGL